MVPVASSTPDRNRAEVPEMASTATPQLDPAKPSTPALSPQARQNKKLQQQLEKSIAEALPSDTELNSNGLISRLTPISKVKDFTVTLDSDWYKLQPSQQEAIAAAIWSQRAKLQFQKLTLKDPQGKTLARPPVVGDQMVILRR